MSSERRIKEKKRTNRQAEPSASNKTGKLEKSGEIIKTVVNDHNKQDFMLIIAARSVSFILVSMALMEEKQFRFRITEKLNSRLSAAQ